MPKKIIIYGAGPLAEIMYYHFTHDSEYEVVAFCLDKDYLTTAQFCHLPLVDFDAVTQLYPPSDFQMFVAIGYKKMRNRAIQFNKAKQKGYNLVNFVSQKAYVRENTQLGENNVIMSSCDIEPFVSIGNNNVFWTRTIIGHHAVIGNHNYISGGGGIGGNCTVGDLCFLGNAALMINNIKISDETYMIAGTIILKDTETASKYHGNPAKLIGRHADTGILIS
ncbi:MAG: acetyltransferase [Methylococcaceae bacterium]|nr:acetyltransferase [Methylococcaceae bacterium]